MDAISYGGGDEGDWDDDTSLVVPLPTDSAVVEQLFQNCICYVRVSFVAANGRCFVGMMCSRDGDGVESTQPAIATDEGQIDFYLGAAGANVPNATRIAANYARLGLTPNELFPLEYRPDASIPGGSLGGVLHGFYFMGGQRGSLTVEYIR
jgi:hypothetical protein